MKFLVATLCILFFSNSNCFADCDQSQATLIQPLTFGIITQGAAGQYIIFPNDLNAAVVSVPIMHDEDTVTASVQVNTGTICKADSPSTCLTVSSPTITAEKAVNKTFTARVGGTVTVLATSPAGIYTGTPSRAVLTCDQ
jgi:hypothetical protein